MKKKIQAIKRFTRCFIGDIIWVFRYYAKLKQQLENCSITNVHIYKFTRWHSGFNYFVGYYGNDKVFIKACCGQWNTIAAEAHLAQYCNFQNHPEIISYQLSPLSWIATRYIESTPIDEVKNNVDEAAIIHQLAEILDKMDRNGIIHRDLRPENIHLNPNGEIILIDFGWAIYRDLDWKKTSYDFIERILNQEFRDKNGKFDDAISVLMSLKSVFPSSTDEVLNPIIERIGKLTV